MAQDITVTDDGDLDLDGGDFQIATEARTEVQEIIFRLRSEKFGYKPNLDLPAGLDDFIGRGNNQALGKQIEERVRYALTWDGQYTAGALKVDAIPVSYSIIAVYLFVTPNVGTGTLSVSFTIDLNSGTISLITD